MTEIVAFSTSSSGLSSDLRQEAIPFVRNTFSIDNTLGLVAKAAETVRSLELKNRELEAEVHRLQLQIESDRSEWQIELTRIDRELEMSQEKSAKSEVFCETLRAESQTALNRCADADHRAALAIRRAEAAEARCHTAEGWLLRIHETIVSEFSDIAFRVAS